MAAQQHSGTTLQVKVSTTDTKPSSFTPIIIFTTGSSSASSNNIGSTFLEDWREKYVTIPDEYIGKPIYIAFHVIDNDGSTIVIDDVSGVSLYSSSYAKPVNLSCSNVTSNTVDISWNAGGEETSWEVQVVCSNGGDEIINRTMPTNSFTISSLMPGTDYYVKVRGNYGDGHYSNWSTVKFTTLPLELFDASDNSDFLMSYNGKKVNVTLTDRTLYKDGNWNTLCLPFAVTNFSKTPLAGATVMTLQSSSFNNADGTLKLNFANATTIEAGKPYIVKWASGADIANPTFKDVIISNATNPVKTDYVDFVGTFSPINIFTEEKTNLYLGADNVLSYPWGDGMTSFTMNSFRAYFQLADGLNESGNAVKSVNMNFGGEATGIGEIPNIKSQTSAPASWYSLDGRKLSNKPTRKGIYIHNGLKVVIQ